MEKETAKSPQYYDIIIAGAGIAATLAAKRIQHSSPDASVALIDKNPYICGKTRPTIWQKQQFSYGMETLSEQLFEFLKNSWSSFPIEKNLTIATKKTEPSIGILSSGKMKQLLIRELLTEKGAKYLFGSTIKTEWEQLYKEIYNPQNITKIIQRSKTSPVNSALKSFCQILGIPSSYHVSGKIIHDRYEYIKSDLYHNNWQYILEKFIDSKSPEKIVFHPNKKIVQAHREQNKWCVQTLEKKFTCRQLVIAQSPWESIEWLEKKEMPKCLLTLALKSKPISLVVLNKKVKKTADLPSKILVSSEQVLISVTKNNLTFTAFIDYEHSTDALSVVKTIKRLKRACRKLDVIYNDLFEEEEHIALHPVGWAQCLGKQDYKLLTKLNDYNYYTPHLAFCGETYGSSYNPDKNIINSILAINLWFNKYR